jgi:hypothetical protein
VNAGKNTIGTIQKRKSEIVELSESISAHIEKSSAKESGSGSKPTRIKRERRFIEDERVSKLQKASSPTRNGLHSRHSITTPASAVAGANLRSD